MLAQSALGAGAQLFRNQFEESIASGGPDGAWAFVRAAAAAGTSAHGVSPGAGDASASRKLRMDNLIVGCGDTGHRVAARAGAAGELVTGVARTAASAQCVRAVGAQALVCDLDDANDSLAQWPSCDRLFYFAPPPRQGECDTRVQRVVAGLGRPPAHVVYISTSGVYGDCGEAWVDEQRPPAPVTARAKRRLDAEQQLQAWQRATVILRTPGIYGPSRLPTQRLRAATPIVNEAESGWTNRIHI